MLIGCNNLRAPEMSRSAVRCAGITLIEAVLSTLVVSIMMVSVLQTLGSAAVADRVLAVQRIGPALTSQLMAEISAAGYEDPGGSPVFGRENGERRGSRKKYDDVDDYHGWSSSPVEDKDGSAISGLSGWTRAVSAGAHHHRNVHSRQQRIRLRPVAPTTCSYSPMSSGVMSHGVFMPHV